jgi:hypothetical protein
MQDSPQRSPRFKLGSRSSPTASGSGPLHSSAEHARQSSVELQRKPASEHHHRQPSVDLQGKPSSGTSLSGPLPPKVPLSPNKSGSLSESKKGVKSGTFVVARESYEGNSSDYISVARGDRLQILQQKGDVIVARTDLGEEGMLPASVCEQTDTPHVPTKKKATLKEKMAETLRSTANTAKSTAQLLSKSGAKAIQKGKGIIAARNSPLLASSAKKEERGSELSAHTALHDDVLKDCNELMAFFDVLLNCVVRPRIALALAARRERALTQPLEVVLGGRRGKLQCDNVSEKVQWATFRHAMKSFGIEDVVESNAGWSDERRQEFGCEMKKFVVSLCLLKDLGGMSSQISDRAELLHALLFAHLPRGSSLRCDDEEKGKANEVILLAMLVLQLGGVKQQGIFETRAEEEQIAEILEVCFFLDCFFFLSSCLFYSGYRS